MRHKIMSIRHLSMSDRSRIEVYLELGWSNSRIAGEIKFSKQAIRSVNQRPRDAVTLVNCVARSVRDD